MISATSFLILHALALFSLSVEQSSQSESSCKEGDLVRYVQQNGTNSPTCLNSTDPRGNPCRTINYALREDNSTNGTVLLGANCSRDVTPDNLCVRLEDGVHRLTGEAQATSVNNLTIEAVNTQQAIIRCRTFPNGAPQQWDNLVFVCSANVTLEGVIIEKCGPVSSGIFSHLSDGVAIVNTIFRNITGIGAKFHESDSIILKNCTFEDNYNELSEDHEPFDQDVIDLQDLDRVSLSGGGLSFVSRLSSKSVTVIVEDCRFLRNHVGFEEINTNRPPLLHADGHGGGAYMRVTKVSNSSFIFRNTIFDSNFARIDGGAIYISISSESNDNLVVFDGCTFTNNSVNDTSGGAITVVFNNASVSNDISIRHSTFHGNSAIGGGAIAVVVHDVGPDPHTFSIENSTFIRNHAVKEGSAVGIFSLLRFDEEPFEIEIKDSTFTANNVDNPTTVNEAVARAAVSSFRFPVQLAGTNMFTHNIGGGISIVDSLITIANNSHLIFEDNEANFGGGLQLVGVCLFVVGPGGVVDFTRNKAHFLGGGLMVNSPVVEHARNFLNRFCVIRFVDPDVPPQKWENVSINFVNNTAKVGGAALYGTDLRRCSWLNLTQSDTVDYTIFTPPKNVSVPFLFSGNRLESIEINQVVGNMHLATSPLNVSFQIENVTRQPGESLSVRLFNSDKFGNSRRGIMCVEFVGLASNNECLRYAIGDVRETVKFDVPEIADASPGAVQQKSITVQFRLPLYSGDNSHFNFTLQVCHPGYTLVGGRCVCSTNDPFVLRCDDNNRYVYIREGNYAYQLENGSLTLLSGVPAALLNCKRLGELPGCLYKFDDPDEQCAPGRKGFFCGKCAKGGVTLDLKSCETQCKMGIAAFIVWSVGVVVVSVLLLGFNVELPAELRAAIFYIQVIGLVFGPYSSVLNDELKNFGFFLDLLSNPLPLPFCLAEELPNFAAALLGYVTPSLALAVAVLYYICARFNSTISSRGAIHGLSLLGLFVYKYLADTTFIMGSCRVTTDDLVFLYDGTQSCLNAEFLPFFVLAVLLTVLIILPAPFVLCILTAKRWSKFDLYHFTDQITKDVRPKCGWYAGWDIGRRLVFILAFFVGVYFDTSLRLLVNFVLATIVLLVHLFTKPFKDKRNNIVEAVILLNLVAVTITYLQPPQGVFLVFLVFFLTLLPYLYAVGYLLGIIVRKIYKKYGQHVLYRFCNCCQHTATPTTQGRSYELHEGLLIKNRSGTDSEDENIENPKEKLSEKKGRDRFGETQSTSIKVQSNSTNLLSMGSENSKYVRDIDLFELGED